MFKLNGKVWITKEDWDLCSKFEEEQQRKLYEFMFGIWGNTDIEIK